MREGQASATAQRVALRRAAHQLLDRPVIFEDPLALAIVGADASRALEADPGAFDRSPIAPFMRAFMAVRSRYAEDALARAVAAGVAQYVVLGAGLDTFAYRNPYTPEALRVFEVDHPATQAWKRARLDEAGIAVPEGVTLVPVDFSRETFTAALTRAGWDGGRPSFFSWLGVTPYLIEQAVLATLADVARLPPGSGIVFDFSVPPDSLPPYVRPLFDVLAARVAAAGEPFVSFFDPAQLAATMRGLGFGRAEAISGAELNARYFDGRIDGLRVGSMACLMDATV
jgi:methyltransferase (TIGR00027 family)